MADDDYDSEQRYMVSERETWGRKIKNRRGGMGLRRGGTKFLGDAVAPFYIGFIVDSFGGWRASWDLGIENFFPGGITATFSDELML